MHFRCRLWGHSWSKWNYEHNGKCIRWWSYSHFHYPSPPEGCEDPSDSKLDEYSGYRRSRTCTNNCGQCEVEAASGRCSSCNGSGIIPATPYQQLGWFPPNEPPLEAFDRECASCDGSGTQLTKSSRAMYRRRKGPLCDYATHTLQPNDWRQPH